MPVDLSDREDDFANAEEEKAKNFDPVPDGKYTVEVEAAKVATSQSGQAMLKWTLRIVGGKFDGRLLWRNNMLETKQNLGWLKRDLAISGIVLAKLNDLNDRAQELVGFCFEVTQKTTGQYSNIYLNRLLSQEEVDKLPPRGDKSQVSNGGNGTSGAARAATEADDVIPF